MPTCPDECAQCLHLRLLSLPLKLSNKAAGVFDDALQPDFGAVT